MSILEWREPVWREVIWSAVDEDDSVTNYIETPEFAEERRTLRWSYACMLRAARIRYFAAVARWGQRRAEFTRYRFRNNGPYQPFLRRLVRKHRRRLVACTPPRMWRQFSLGSR
jgi:hypothetical protein